MPRGAQRRTVARGVGTGLVALVLAGCAAGPEAPPVAGDHATVAGVPFVPQSDYQCGPAALAMVLGFWGVPADEEAIARDVYVPSVQGTLNLELEFYARRLGFRTEAFPGTLDRLRREVRLGRPLIVFVDLGAGWLRGLAGPRPHFAVLVGFDDRTGEVVLHSGTTPSHRVRYAEFERMWAARRHWTLLITRPTG